MCSLCCSAARAGSHAAPAITGAFQRPNPVSRSANGPAPGRRHSGTQRTAPRLCNAILQAPGRQRFPSASAASTEDRQGAVRGVNFRRQQDRQAWRFRALCGFTNRRGGGMAKERAAWSAGVGCLAWLPCAWLPWPGRWPCIESRADGHGSILTENLRQILGESRANLQKKRSTRWQGAAGRNRPCQAQPCRPCAWLPWRDGSLRAGCET